MKAVEYLRNIGIDRLLDECNNNLKMVKAYLMRECSLSNANDVEYAMKLVKKRLKERIQSNLSCSSVKKQVVKILKEVFNV